MNAFERAADDLVVLSAVNHSLRQEVVALMLDIAILRERGYREHGREPIRARNSAKN
ncbi:hypothetical protein [Bradyrhizobium guangzhouense]|uniref:hypothetical protein n=1 Tax=Bradyrhizobium guangzhouense TaxID=1325095 RepID=UPI0013E8BFC6|nr:hypothetical protein [Bradyrhizobium guangzhouense]